MVELLQRLARLVGRLVRPTGARREVLCRGAAGPARLRLPPGERWQWATDAALGGVTMNLEYGSQVLAGLEVLGAAGLSAVHVHPGPDTFVSFNGPQGTRVWIYVSPSYEEA